MATEDTTATVQTNEERLALILQAKKLMEQANELVAKAGCNLIANEEFIEVIPVGVSFEAGSEGQNSDDFISDCPSLLTISHYYPDEVEVRGTEDVPDWWAELGKSVNEAIKQNA